MSFVAPDEEASVYVQETERELRRLAMIEFEHRGCQMLREKDNAYLLGEIAKRDAIITRLEEIHVRRDDDPYILGPTCRRCNQHWPCATASVLGKR